MSVFLPPGAIDESTVKDNLFSKHDNRHTLQHCGEYFGQGLGKQRLESSNQHRSSNHISWLDNQPTYCSTYKQGYSKHRRSLSASTPQSSRNTDEYLLNKFHILTKPTFRRFPRHHTLPGTTFRPEDLVSTTLWQQTRQLQTRESAYSTPLSKLAATQQPFLQHSRSWQYSYKQ